MLIVEGTGSTPPEARPSESESEGVLAAAGSRIKALLTGGSEPAAGTRVAAESAPAVDETSDEIVLTAAADRGETAVVAAESESASAAPATKSVPKVEPDQVQSLLALAQPESGSTLEDLGAAIKSVTQPIASIDVLDDTSVAAGVVLVVTPTSTGTAVVLDAQGYVLANWHVVDGFSRVTVVQKERGGDGAAYDGVYSAEVLRISRFADLALLKIDEPPDDLHPVALASHGDLDKGDVVHTISHPADRVWTHTVGKVVRSRDRASWYSGNKILHRAATIHAKLLDSPGVSGSALFNNSLQLVGIGAQWSSSKEQVTAVSVDTIRKFLSEEAAAQAVASSDG